jgi:nucleoside-diphosphate-sugar epimerase
VAALLTGVGYIGAALLHRLTEGEPTIVALDNYYCTSKEAVEAALPANTVMIEGDVANKDDVARAFDRVPRDEPLVVYHLAAQPSAAVAMREPELTERSNLIGARHVLESARDRGARVVFGGSFRVYGDDLLGLTVDEDTPYGRVGDLSHLSKMYVEQLARMLGVPFVSARLGVTYGLSPIMKTDPRFMTAPNLFCRRAEQGEVLNVIEDRPMAFIHVEDAAEALVSSAQLVGTNWQVVNAAPEVATIGEVARIVQSLVQKRGGWARVHGAAGADASFSVSSRLDFKPRRTLADGLADVLDFFASHQ